MARPPSAAPPPLSADDVRSLLRGREAFARLSPADFDDIVSEVVERVWAYRSRDVQDWRALAFVIARNEIWRRARRRRPSVAEADVDAVGSAHVAEVPGPLETLEANEKRALLAAAIEELSPDERLVLKLSYFEDKSADEIAVVIGRSRSQVFRIRLAALARLQRTLANFNVD